MRNKVLPIENENLSIAWAQAFIASLASPGGALSRLVVTIKIPESGVSEENEEIRELLDNALAAKGQGSVDTIANTIFPQSLWNPGRQAKDLFDRYDHIWPRIQRCPANRNGVYFRRLTAFGEDGATVNQLSHIIDTWKNYDNHRHSALQAAVFDPRKDHVNSRQRGFPCLHQVAFDAQGANGKDGLVVTGFYAMQTLFEKAYGNYLGLARLGRFMAHELNLRLVEVTCIASVAKCAGKASAGEMAALNANLRPFVEAQA